MKEYWGRISIFFKYSSYILQRFTRKNIKIAIFYELVINSSLWYSSKKYTKEYSLKSSKFNRKNKTWNMEIENMENTEMEEDEIIIFSCATITLSCALEMQKTQNKETDRSGWENGFARGILKVHMPTYCKNYYWTIVNTFENIYEWIQKPIKYV